MDINDNIKNRADLKSYFIKNAIPTESNFAEFIESVINQREDGLVKMPGAPLSIEASGDASSQKRAINLYSDFVEEKPDWVFSLNPRSNPADPGTASPGLSISDADGNSRFFVDQATGKVGVANITPEDELDVAGNLRILSNTNPLRFTSAWSNFPATGVDRAEISNDTTNYKTLMIIGNRSQNAAVRRVSIWDRLEINGNLVINGAGNLEFGATVRQMINLWRTDYGIGVQSGTQYFRTGSNFAWYKGGNHHTGALNPGGGVVQMVIKDRNVGIGTTNPLKQLHIQEGAIVAPLLNETRRPGIALTGQYPELNLFSKVANANHGPTIRLGSYDAATGAATKQWVMGTAGQNSRFLDFGFSTNTSGNPHYGIRNAGGKTVMTLLENGNVGIGALEPVAKLDVAGHIRTTGAITAPAGTIRDANGGWVRTYGNSGWYSQTYGGGWYMTDTTWIRSYGSKSIYHNAGNMRTDGTLQVGGSGSTLSVTNGGNLSYRSSVLFANTAGRVGIGTTGPTATFHVNGSARVNSLYIGNQTVDAYFKARFMVTSGYVATSARGTGRIYNTWTNNYALIYPPSGFTMAHLMGFCASIALVHYAGDVNGDDSIWCKWRKESNLVRVICNNSENRAGSAINYLAIWRK